MEKSQGKILHTHTHIKELLMRIFWNNKVNSKLSKIEPEIILINIYSESNYINQYNLLFP